MSKTTTKPDTAPQQSQDKKQSPFRTVLNKTKNMKPVPGSKPSSPYPKMHVVHTIYVDRYTISMQKKSQETNLLTLFLEVVMGTVR